MARLLGEARVSILPDGTRFKPEAEAAVKRGLAGVSGKVKLDLDTKGLDAKLAAEGAKIIAMQNRVAKARQADAAVEARDIASRTKMYAGMFDQIGKAEADAAKGRANAAADLSRQFNAQLGNIRQVKNAQDKAWASYGRNLLASEKLDAARAKAVVDQAKAFESYSKNIRIGVDGNGFMVKIARLREEAKAALSDIKAKVSIDRNSVSSVGNYISGAFTKSLASRFEKAGNSSGQSFLQKFGGAFTQSNAIAVAVVAGLAALPAAVGAIGVLAGIALGVGLVIGAESLIKKRLKTLNAEIKSQTTVLNAKSSTPAMKQASAALIKQDQAQIAVLNRQFSAFIKLNSAVADLKNSFLNFAVVVSKPLLKPFIAAADRLSAQLNGPLRGSFTALFKAVGPLVKPVEDALLSIVKGILPGLTFMLNKARGPLSALFEGFGKIVGLKIGDWFRAATPYIKVSSTYFLKLVSALGSVVTWLIKFGGEAAKAFGGSQFKGFGAVISSIGNSLTKIVIPAFEGWTAVMGPVIKELLQILEPILAFLAAHPALVKAIFAIIAALQIMSKAVTVLVAVTELLGLSLDAIPFVALAAAVILATILIIKHWGQISAFFVRVWKAIWSGAIGPMINFFTNTVPHAFGVTLNWLKKNWPLLIGIVGGPFAAIAGVIFKYHNQIFNVIKGAWGHIENVIFGVLKPVASVINGVWTQVYKVTRIIWNGIYQVIRIPALIIVGLVGQAWRGIKNLTGLVWPWIYKTIKDAWGHIENVTTGAVKPVVSVTVGAWRSIANATVSHWNQVFKVTKDVWGHVENVVTGIVKPIASVVLSQWRKTLRDTIAQWTAVYIFSKAVWGRIYNVTTSIVKTMVNVVNGLWKTLASWTRSGFTTVYNYIISPLQRAASWISGVFVRSVKGAFSGLVSAVKGIWNGLKRAVADPINFVGGLWNKFAGFVNKGLSVFGIKQALPSAPVLKFAKGGKVPGFAPGSDTIRALLSPGEYVINPKAVKAIGAKNLDRLNSLDSHHPGQRMMTKDSRSAFANGGDVVNDIVKWNGHPYRWGGGANPSTGWDCSSFVNWIVGHDFKLNLPGGGSWGSMTSNGRSHGPVAAAYNNWNYGHHVPWSAAKKGDLAIEDNGAHIGFIIQDNVNKSSSDTLMGFAARSTATGTGYENFFPSAFHLERFADDRGFGSQVFDNTIGAVLKPLAALALNGIKGLVNSGLNHIPGKGPIPKLAKAAVSKVMNAAIGKLTSNQSNYQFDPAATGPAGEGTSAGELANGRQIYNYLLRNLFGGNKIAAAGATASIWGESTWNPFAQGTGGRGLIGWTPPSTISNADFNGGMRTQLPAILRFVVNSGDQGAIAKMFHATSVTDAANIWGKDVERFGINDVHSTGIALATRFMKNGGAVFDNGGTLAPGANMVYNLTGKPEALVRPGGGGGQDITVTMELGPNFKRQTGLTDQELADIRYTVRTKGGQGPDAVQRAFGRNN